ncbi:type II toxin-antitoxin system RelE/ParE family toxin [Salmonella enterica subsp. enterica serovar Poona]|nr:type II toxin-antitoxin system RelE/ParE family toxin [Salmonella enterica subsp. enterica serovar Newport]ECJ4050458.1 type II toxin-antitoxin system RelE/ParE family toxin [Salmonella enterica subsp. enterica]ECO1514226.1 type II toxin-antitoxin system RelE/ParE family toxin [Salmonella enterica subsp. arizonae]EDJ2557527.1 type II toxin-antitoxin system RelE/ParE family toxin [Salmonella enterica subsp. enterica serovar Poona]
MKAVAFSPAAEADIGEIWDYSADRWGPDQADNYTDAIRDTCYALARGTKRGRPAEVLPDFQKYLCGSHVVYFLDNPDHLDVIRILHQRQDAQLHL